MPRVPAAGLNAAGNAVLTAGTTYYLSLHTADPGTTGANEMSGVTRQAVVFSTWASGASGNNAVVTVANPGTTAATYVVVWSASTSGTPLWGMAMASSVTAASIQFPVGAVAPSVS